MVTEAELASKVHQFLQSSDLKKTTNNIVIKKLEADFGVDLSDKKSFLRHQVDRFLQSQYGVSDDDDDDQLVWDSHAYDVVSDDDDEDDDDDDVEGGGYYDAVPQVQYNISNNNNGGSKLKGVNKLDRLVPQKKEKNKRPCFSGKYCTLSPELQAFLGVPHMTRTEVIKQLWVYVKEKSLQDPDDGKSIICDETLRDLLGVDSINILQIHKALTKHIIPRVKPLKGDKLWNQEKGEEVKLLKLDKPLKREKEEEEEVKPLKGDKIQKHEKEVEVKLLKGDKPLKQEEEEDVKPLKKYKPRKQGREADNCEDGTQEKRQRKVLSGFLAPLPLSDTLIRFLGTGETALTRPEVIKRVWKYIKNNRLQDPLSRKTILCDEKLKELLNLDSFHGFTVSKLLTPHFVKMSGSAISLPQNELKTSD
ncbi:uncharacterized protein LOC141643474 isoform X2 [Silene latifolia]|uniref:uncharacterized protein LOC141643474 isoform X2 n=1 Tax=Silene latifolia TaxID=37657 RepID=UPI003D7792E3